MQNFGQVPFKQKTWYQKPFQVDRFKEKPIVVYVKSGLRFTKQLMTKS